MDMSKAIQVRTTKELKTQTEIMSELIGRFIAAQDVKPSSRALYRRTIAQYLNWTVDRGLNLKDVTRAEIIEYKDDLLARGMSSLSVGSYLTVVRKFYEWTEASKLYPNVAKGIKTPKRKQAFKKLPLTPEQTTKLLTYFQDRQSEGLRDFAIINLLS